MQVNKRIVHLSLTGLVISDDLGAENGTAMGDALKVWRVIILECSLACKVNSTLTSLIMFRNNLGSQGGAPIAEAIMVPFAAQLRILIDFFVSCR